MAVVGRVFGRSHAATATQRPLYRSRDAACRTWPQKDDAFPPFHSVAELAWIETYLKPQKLLPRRLRTGFLYR
jgi:hypothetical protein